MEPMEQTFSTAGTVQLVVENSVGSIVVSAHETATTRVVVEALTPGAEDLVSRTIVANRSFGGRDHVVVKVPRVHGMKFMRRNGVVVRVQVPAGTDVSVASASADVELNGLLGQVDIKSSSGNVTGDDATELRVKTASGDIEMGTVSGNVIMHSASGNLRCARVDGRASMSTASGELELGSAADRIDVRATSGNVRVGDVAGDVHIVAVSGNVQVLSVSAGSMRVRSVSGNVDVGIAPGATLSVDAESMSGDVRSDIPLHDRPAAPGAPQVTLHLRTVSGNILLERGVEAFVR